MINIKINNINFMIILNVFILVLFTCNSKEEKKINQSTNSHFMSDSIKEIKNKKITEMSMKEILKIANYHTKIESERKHIFETYRFFDFKQFKGRNDTLLADKSIFYKVYRDLNNNITLIKQYSENKPLNFDYTVFQFKNYNLIFVEFYYDNVSREIIYDKYGFMESKMYKKVNGVIINDILKNRFYFIGEDFRSKRENFADIHRIKNIMILNNYLYPTNISSFRGYFGREIELTEDSFIYVHPLGSMYKNYNLYYQGRKFDFAYKKETDSTFILTNETYFINVINRMEICKELISKNKYYPHMGDYYHHIPFWVFNVFWHKKKGDEN